MGAVNRPLDRRRTPEELSRTEIMIEPKNLLTDLQRLTNKLEDDLGARCKELPEVDARGRAEYNRAKQADRTAAAYEVWRDEFITQAGVAWALGCVFVRFIEDNSLVKTS